MAADEHDAVIEAIRKLLDEGKSLAITTLDNADELGPDGYFELSDAASKTRRCLQYVILPDGRRICIRWG